MLAAEHLEFSYGQGESKLKVLDGISASFPEGSITAIVGPSGCGKTTLLDILAGMILPERGQVVNSPTNVGYVFQAPSLIPWRSVRDNILLGPEIGGSKRSVLTHSRLAELIQQTGLVGFERYFPAALSGGMQQRVSFARALLSLSGVVLLDEPFSNADFLVKRELQSLLCDHIEEHGVTAILVTHDLEDAVKIADSIVILSPRPAHVLGHLRLEPRGRKGLRADLELMQKCLKEVEDILVGER